MFKALVLLAGLLPITMAAVLPTLTTTNAFVHKRITKPWFPNANRTSFMMCDHNSISFEYDNTTKITMHDGPYMFTQELDCQTLLSDKSRALGVFLLDGSFGGRTGQDWISNEDILWGGITCNVAAHVNTSDQV